MGAPAHTGAAADGLPWRVLALFGPTGIGKTAVAIAMAERLRDRGATPVAVSADALQVYAGLGILTGAADAGDQERLPHRMVGVLPVDATFSAGAYAQRAHAEIDALLAEGAVPIVVGGTGLYLRAALADLDFKPPAPAGVRAGLNTELARDGAPSLHARLARARPRVAARIEPGDGQRVVRALELVAVGAHNEPEDARAPGADGRDSSQLWTADMRHPTRLIGLTMRRDALYSRIDQRVEAMVAAGAAEEVRAALAAGASATARKAVGFDELQHGDVAAMQLRTRRLAKRQLTWMRKLAHAEIIDVIGREAADVAAEILP